MKPAEFKAWLEILPSNTAAFEAGAEGVKIQFFPPQLAPPAMPADPGAPPQDVREPAPPHPDVTLQQLMGQTS